MGLGSAGKKHTPMDGQRQRSGGRKRRRKSRPEAKSAPEPVLIAARRPNSPLLSSRNGKGVVAASAVPGRRAEKRVSEPCAQSDPLAHQPEKRAARIVRLPAGDRDAAEQRRLRLLERLMVSDGRGAITRAANEYTQEGFVFPEEQEVQLQLLEHFDEEHARNAITILSRLLLRSDPIKKPVLDQRLRRLEEYADDPTIREAAAALRRSIR